MTQPITNMSNRTYIEIIGEEIADVIFPITRGEDGSYVVDGRRTHLNNLLTAFAKEIKRASIEGDF